MIYPDKHPVVRIERGDVPVIVTVPHGIGQDESCGLYLAERKNGGKLEELRLFPLTWSFVERLRATWGAPYVVIPLVHRSRVDFSRGKALLDGERAFDDARAAPLYDAFEALLAETIAAAFAGSSCGLLLDLHGCLTGEQDVFIGTRNGQTVTVQDGVAFGRDAIVTHLHRAGWRVSPQPGEPERKFAGRPDSIIARHSQVARGGRYAAVQLEVSRAVRLDDARRTSFAHDLADAVAGVFR